MKKLSILALPLFAFVLMGQGCEWNVKTGAEEANIGTGDTEVSDMFADAENSERVQVENDLRNRLRALDADYESWKREVEANIEATPENTRAELRTEWDDLQERLNDLYADAVNSVNTLTAATAAGWDEARVIADDAVEEMESAFVDAQNSFN